ncbi:hypothetical protein HYS31_04245 [Candidatus Woesearchaeota archaeon]|nr:hypothetical protein [Candidatus Woesearchaeota archaeon]
MDAENTYIELKNIALQEFPDIVVSANFIRGPLGIIKSLRLFLIDNSFLEIWISGSKYSYHWRRTDGMVYRHDNAPHKKHKHVKTFPKHFHDGSENNVKESYLSDDTESSVKEFLRFIREKIK